MYYVFFLPSLLPVLWLLSLVGLDAADVVGGAFHQRVHQVISLFLKEKSREAESQLIEAQ